MARRRSSLGFLSIFGRSGDLRQARAAELPESSIQGANLREGKKQPRYSGMSKPISALAVKALLLS